MRIAHVLICFSYDPQPLFDSIPHRPGAIWYVFFHRENPTLLAKVDEILKSREGRVFAHNTNRGLSRSWNDAIDAGLRDSCDAILLLNDDMHFYPKGYDTFIATIEREMSRPEIAFITTNGREGDNSFIRGRVIHQDMACAALTRQAIEKVGYFDENFVPAYCEDLDYMRRCDLAGLTRHLETDVLLLHERSSTLAMFEDDVLAKMMKQKEHCLAYFRKKWGTDDSKYYMTPFNADFGPKIEYSSRAHPYGPGRDRDFEAEAAEA